MKKSYKFKELDCANCAAKIEREINKIPGVEKATVNFFAMMMTVTADDNRFDEIMQEIVKVCKKVEPDCELEV